MKSLGLTLHSKLADEEVERLVLVPYDIKESGNLSLYAILSRDIGEKKTVFCKSEDRRKRNLEKKICTRKAQ